MNLTPIAEAAAVIATGILVVHILSGKKLEEFIYSSEYANFTQYFFRPKSLVFALFYGSVTAASTWNAIKSSWLTGNEFFFTLAAFFSTFFMLLIYNCWSGSAARKLLILLLAVSLTAIYWVLQVYGNVDIRESLSALASLSLFTGCIFALWLRAY